MRDHIMNDHVEVAAPSLASSLSSSLAVAVLLLLFPPTARNRPKSAVMAPLMLASHSSSVNRKYRCCGGNFAFLLLSACSAGT